MGVPETDVKKHVEGDWDNGVVFYRPQGAGRAIRLYDKSRGAEELHVSEEASSSGLDFDFQGNLEAINSPK